MSTLLTAKTVFLLILAAPIMFPINKSRAHPQDSPTSRQAMHSVADPSHHDSSFDHTAFLGAERAAEFNKLTPEESKARLSKLVKKVDVDSDGKITEKELYDWVSKVANESAEKEVSTQWAVVNKENLTEIDFKTYSENLYGPHEERDKDPQNGDRYRKMLKKDKRRFAAADLDGNGKLSRSEFSPFTIAENNKHMEDVLAEELLESIDTNDDRKISLQEYITDIGNSMGATKEEATVGSSWANRFEDEFKTHRDSNGDGFLDIQEIKKWIMPDNYDPMDAEAKHLIFYADTNKDGHLTEEEILEKADLFAGSQATDFGKALSHEEL